MVINLPDAISYVMYKSWWTFFCTIIIMVCRSNWTQVITDLDNSHYWWAHLNVYIFRFIIFSIMKPCIAVIKISFSHINISHLQQLTLYWCFFEMENGILKSKSSHHNYLSEWSTTPLPTPVQENIAAMNVWNSALLLPMPGTHFQLWLFNYCVVPENIQAPTTEGIGNSRGVGGSKAQEIPEGRGVGP